MPTLVDQQPSNSDGPFGLIDGGTYSAMAQGYTPSKTYTMTQLELSIVRVGNPTGTIQARIRQVSGGDPGTSITNGDSNTLNASSISTTNSFVAFTFPTSPSVTNATLYYIELTHSGGTFDSSNYIGWHLISGNTYAGGDFKFKVGGGAWTADTDPDMAFKTYEEASSASSSVSLSPSLSSSASASPTPSSSISRSPSLSLSLSPSVTPSASISLSPSASPSPSENTLSVDLVCLEFIIIYSDKYASSGTAYTDKYSRQNTEYIDKYDTKTDSC